MLDTFNGRHTWLILHEVLHCLLLPKDILMSALMATWDTASALYMRIWPKRYKEIYSAKSLCTLFPVQFCNFRSTSDLKNWKPQTFKWSDRWQVTTDSQTNPGYLTDDQRWHGWCLMTYILPTQTGRCGPKSHLAQVYLPDLHLMVKLMFEFVVKLNLLKTIDLFGLSMDKIGDYFGYDM